MNVLNKIFITKLCIAVALVTGCSGQAPKEMSTMALIKESLIDKQPISKTLNQDSGPSVAINNALMGEQSISGSKNKSNNEDLHFDLDVSEVPASAFFMGLVKDTPYRMVVHPGVEGNISLGLQDTTVKEVLETIKSVYGYDYIENAKGFEVLPSSIQTRIYRLDYLSMTRSGNSTLDITGGSSGSSSGSSGGGATGTGDVSTTFKQDIWTEVSDILKKIIGSDKGREVSLSPQTGIILVRGMPDELRKVEEFLKKVQSSLNRQVLLEVKIIEVDLADQFRAGINWGAISGLFSIGQIGSSSALGSALGSLPGGTGTKTTAPGADPSGTASKASLSGDAFGGMFSMAISNKHFSTFMEFLDTQGNSQVLSSPRVSTLNNQKAIIKVGTDLYFATGQTTGVTSGSSSTTSTTSNSVTLSQYFSGIALDVTPFVDEDDNITLHVHPAITTVTSKPVTGAGVSFDTAQTDVRESDTMIRAKNGQIVIIGGLMKNQTNESVSSVPFFGRIPFIGSIFRQTVQQKTKSELVILLRPIIVDDDKWAEPVRDEQKQLEALNRGFHWGGRKELFGTIGETHQLP